ncbi:transposase [Streptomyces sp. ActVer]|uniref:transposase n=1 Tax=Streptomyces sp. ActVer TaxID=3014558 RepID=UPI0022B3E25C|nr:transposase [Streptomyces sp. ActVer]MCZ4507906.1 transposase [Streptomyces sp. ActVer]
MPLTTVRVPFDAIAAAAVDQLIDLIAGVPTSARTFAPTLIPRRTTVRTAGLQAATPNRHPSQSTGQVVRLDQSLVGPGVPLTDVQWARIEPLLPDRTPKRGGRSRDHREVIEAIACKSQTGIQWIHLPEKYEPHARGYRPRAVPCGSTARHRADDQDVIIRPGTDIPLSIVDLLNLPRSCSRSRPTRAASY